MFHFRGPITSCLRKLSCALAQAGGDVAIHVEEHFVVVDDLLEDEGEFIAIDAVDHGVDALLKRSHRVEGFEEIADEEGCGMTAGVHGHALDGGESFVLFRKDAAEGILDHDDLVLDAVEAGEEIFV